MTVTFVSRSARGTEHSSVPQPARRPLDSRAISGSIDVRREQLQQEALRWDLAARNAAELGDIEASARAILALLDCERRLASTGPQVLQVIKPRS
jgi:hypothetical protein